MQSVLHPNTSSLSPSPSALAGSGRQAFQQSLSQHARLISIETPLEAGALLVDSFTGQEAMSAPFRFDIDCLATSAHYALTSLIGEEISLRLLLANGGTRPFHGIVTRAQQRGADGSLARYRLRLAPWTHALTLRRDSYVFQDKTVLEIIEEVLQDYP
ncbi:MAG TPA: contractile injection system protein, VgrG/Pvc8 family, partial [Noviherbaspirillum sp.]|nr:contractile injection system protein, VgrG/Pvc8 family [Noviherbaspirillum sp.]